MARTVKEVAIDKRAARERLVSRHEPYWRKADEDGAHIGYRRGANGGRWVARFRKVGDASKAYAKTVLGEADDSAEADGARVLDFKQAQEAARAWFEQQGGRRKVVKGKAYTIGDALTDYLVAFDRKSLMQTRARVEAIIRPALGNLDTAKLTARKLADWHRDRASSPAKLRTGKFALTVNERALTDADSIRRRRSTANRDFTVLKAALNLAFREGHIRSDEAWRKVKPFKGVDGAKIRYLSDVEAQRLVNAMDPAFRPLVQAALLTGARYGNLTTARVRDFDAIAGTLRLSDTKGGHAMAIYLEGEGVTLFKRAALGKPGDALLFPRPDGGPWKAAEQSRKLEAACIAGSVDRATFHDLRRTYGARLARAGVPMAVIAEALGHADERMTRKHYAHLAPSYVAATIRQHAAGMGIVEADVGNVRAIGAAA